MEKEIWKVYKDTSKYPNGHLYEVSSLGNIKIDGIIQEPKLFNGYYVICGTFLHRIIAKTFIPNKENKPCVDHINGNKLDNKVSNLRWATYSENMNNKNTKRFHNSKEHNNKISETLKGNIPWNKGIKGVKTNNKGQIPWNKGLKIKGA